MVQQAQAGSAIVDDRLNMDGLNINYAGYALAAGFSMVVLLWVTKPRTLRRRLSLAITAAALILGIVLSDTRGAFVGLALMAAWLILCFLFKRPPYKALVFVVLLVAFSIATGILDRASLVLEGLLGRATGDWSGRLIIWPLAREDWSHHFLLGTGVSTFLTRNYLGIGAHDLILELGTGTGIIGVLIYVTFLWSSLGKRTSLAGEKPATILIGCFIAVSAFSYLTGHWELSPAAFVGLAAFSRTSLIGKDPAMLWSGTES